MAIRRSQPPDGMMSGRLPLTTPSPRTPSGSTKFPANAIPGAFTAVNAKRRKAAPPAAAVVVDEASQARRAMRAGPASTTAGASSRPSRRSRPVPL